MSKVIRFNLSPASIRKAIAETNRQKEEIQKLCNAFAKYLAMEAVANARNTLITTGSVFTEKLLEGVTYDYVSPGVWKVTAYAATPDGKYNYAYFVEYGTGPRGKASNHPEADGIPYRDKGWWTAADGKDMKAIYGWRPKKGYDDGNNVYYTEGQEGVRFMYNSKQHIQNREIYDKCLAKAMQEVFRT